MGRIERPSSWQKESTEKHFVILDQRVLTSAQFYQEMNTALSRAPGVKSAFLFIHGFNVPFVDAAYRTAQISADLGLSSVPVFYSWPSNGSLPAYTWDFTAASQTIPRLVAVGAPVSLYASQADKALTASMGLWGGVRAGSAGADLIVLPGLETMDASNVNTDFLGHSAYGDSRILLGDLAALFRGFGASSRFGLTKVPTATGTYWEFKR
ncbi:hypothetical protein H6P1_00209 (plasmid) [Variovorax sp. PBL-H6]|uniref:alpha/beta hydrolase n=2 Tax=Variovorax TaxID=34072 RepID=UPI001316985C|nr:alpha/beta hydrolase [Variovorax sp. PBL-H6]VTU42510.1 hypothetical protein H6P1_00209 [Variovorax sp. PBL-H6]VTU43880.1 hypothetical protein SRS16P1_00693 [Variovorax sp. SRS16]VTU43950.1 hypothetical protein E5P1_00686 [Variovorax sp. PBL-E5]